MESAKLLTQRVQPVSSSPFAGDAGLQLVVKVLQLCCVCHFKYELLSMYNLYLKEISIYCIYVYIINVYVRKKIYKYIYIHIFISVMIYVIICVHYTISVIQ